MDGPRYEHCIMNSVDAFLVLLTHAAIKVAYHNYMLTSCVNVCGMLNFNTFVPSKKISSLNEQPKDKQ